MEFCGGGSISDILRSRKQTLKEESISVVLSDTLKGLEYLHTQRKIHRDVKCGNILLTNDGLSKLADFGVAGQLTETQSKRDTLIGTPVWTIFLIFFFDAHCEFLVLDGARGHSRNWI